MYHFHDHDRPTDLNTHEGLTDYLTHRIKRPALLDKEAFLALTPSERATYNRSRHVFLSGGITITTDGLTKAKMMLGRFMLLNLSPTGGRNGLILSGDSTLGKTTMCKALMTDVFKAYRIQFPGFDPKNRVPVVFINVPPGCTGKLLMSAFANFFDITVRPRDTMINIQSKVIAAMHAARTQLVVVDELHNLDANNRGNGESKEVLKELHNRATATFVYAGVGIQSSALLSGVRGNQIGGRFTELDLIRYNLSDAEHRSEWAGIIAGFERDLLLRDHTPGTLVKMGPYLHDRTGGSIGSLGRLITSAAIDVIERGDAHEEVTKIHLDEIELDIAAERHYRAIRNGKKRAA